MLHKGHLDFARGDVVAPAATGATGLSSHRRPEPGSADTLVRVRPRDPSFAHRMTAQRTTRRLIHPVGLGCMASAGHSCPRLRRRSFVRAQDDGREHDEAMPSLQRQSGRPGCSAALAPPQESGHSCLRPRKGPLDSARRDAASPVSAACPSNGRRVHF